MSGAANGVAAAKGSSLWKDAWKRLRRNRLAMGGAVVLVVVVLVCFLGPSFMESEAFGGYDAERTDLVRNYQSPGEYGRFGTDALGRDFLIRVLVGGQTSLLVGLAATVSSLIIGVLYGSIAGYYGGRMDEIMMRIVDFLFGIPYMFLVILLMLMFSDEERQNPVPIFFALGLVQWLTMARIVRGQTLTIRKQEYVQAARVLGASDARIIFKHVLPNVISVVIVYATLTVPAVILLESFLSFLGLGVELSWGVLVSEGVKVVNPIKSYWWLLFFPSLLLAVTLFSLNFLGDGLRDALDPKTRKE
jgi:oligopeptide transport system permease protein